LRGLVGWLALGERDSADDFVRQLGIRVHDDLHGHVEIVALRPGLLTLLRVGAVHQQAQS
jgi:hypothetical protein